jgi:tetratricopeptide (TPR) repeat protein
MATDSSFAMLDVAEAPASRKLYARGRALAAFDPVRGIAVLEEALGLAEQTSDSVWVARAAHALASARCDLGQYAQARDWAEWGLRLYGRVGLEDHILRLQLQIKSALAHTLGGVEVPAHLQIEQLQSELRRLDAATPEDADEARIALAELVQLSGQSEDALSICQAAWESSVRREHIAVLACTFVQAALASGNLTTARSVADRAIELTRGLNRVYRRWAMLAYGCAIAAKEPGRAVLMLRSAADEFRSPLVAVRAAQASLYLARTLTACGDDARAASVLDDAAAVLGTLDQRRQAVLCPSPGVPCRNEQTPWLELHFLGRSEARLGDRVLPMRPRFVELLASLALHPEGRTLEQLALDVYGEGASLSLCKTEISRLRRLLPIQNRPYRLGARVSADFLDVRRLLGEGQVDAALAAYGGSLLPRSDAPIVNAARDDLDIALRQAVLSRRNPEAVWLLAERMPDDLELWEEVCQRLARSDPRRFLAKARVARLQHEWDSDDEN